MKGLVLEKDNKATHLARYDNSWFNPGPRWKIALWFFVSAIFFKSGLSVFYKLKCMLLRIFGGSVGKRVIIKPNVNIKYPWFLKIGNDVWIGEHVWIDNLTTVTIGNNVCVSQGAYLLTGNHDYSKQTFDLTIGEISIEEGAWLGAKSVVCPGVVCRSHSVLAVASVATKELEAYCIYQGIPAQKIKKRIID